MSFNFKIISSFSEADKKHLKKEGISLDEYAAVKKSIDQAYGREIAFPQEAKKISKNEIKRLQDFINKYSREGIAENWKAIEEASMFVKYGFTVSAYRRRQLDDLFSRIESTNKNVVIFDFSKKREEEGSDSKKGKKVW